jgi:hypothetical protein
MNNIEQAVHEADDLLMLRIITNRADFHGQRTLKCVPSWCDGSGIDSDCIHDFLLLLALFRRPYSAWVNTSRM